MKYQILGVYTFLYIFSFLTSCQNLRESDCSPLQQPLEVMFEDSILVNFCKSPFDAEKMWVQSSNNPFKITQIDLKTGKKRALENEYARFYRPNNMESYYQKDPYDAFIWFALPGSNVVLYNPKTDVFWDIAVSNVQRIIPRPNEVYFVSDKGLLYWDRKTKSLTSIPGMPPKNYYHSTMPNDSTLFLNAEFTFYFNSKTVKEGVYIGDFKFSTPNSSYEVADEVGLFYRKNSLWYYYKDQFSQLPLPQNNLGGTKIINQQFWQSDGRNFYCFDPKTNTVKTYPFRLPNLYQRSIDYVVDDHYIWIKQQGQIMLIRLTDNQQFEYPIKVGEIHLKTTLDDCNAYLLYQNKVVVVSKEDFFKQCIPFDPNQYELELNMFETVVDSLGIGKDTIASTALSKLNYLKARYAQTEHIETKQAIEILNTGAFQSVRRRLPEGYIACYKDTAMPISQRLSCITYLMHQYAHSAKFEALIALEKDYYHYFSVSGEERNADMSIVMDSVKRYLLIVDSLQKTTLTKDSIYYFKTNALGGICVTPWFCSQGCAGCDFSLVMDNLKSLSTKFKQSKLCDNADYYLLVLSYNLDYSDDGEIELHIERLNNLLKKYPDTDLKADIQYDIFTNWSSMYTKNKKMIQASAQNFIQSFGTDERVKEIKRVLRDLESQ